MRWNSSKSPNRPHWKRTGVAENETRKSILCGLRRVVLDVPRLDAEESLDAWRERSVWLCYHALGLVQRLEDCEAVPRVKDYISFPKPNGLFPASEVCVTFGPHPVHSQRANVSLGTIHIDSRREEKR